MRTVGWTFIAMLAVGLAVSAFGCQNDNHNRSGVARDGSTVLGGDDQSSSNSSGTDHDCASCCQDSTGGSHGDMGGMHGDSSGMGGMHGGAGCTHGDSTDMGGMHGGDGGMGGSHHGHH